MKVSDKVKLLQATRHIRFVAREFEHNGSQGWWSYATRRAVSREGILGEDTMAVVVIARVGKLTKPDYVLNREFRVPLGGWEIAFPAGLMNPGESPEEAAAREFSEETPYRITSIGEVSLPLASSPGITDEMVYIVRCWAEEKPDKATARETGEEIETFLASDTNDPRIPKGDGIVWSVRAWMELSAAARAVCSTRDAVRDPRYSPFPGDILVKGDMEREVIMFDGMNVGYLSWRVSKGNRAGGATGKASECKIGTWLNWAGNAKVTS